MARKYTESGKREFERPSERMFRRSRAAENRRRIKDNKDQRFFRFIFGLASIGIFATFVVIVFMTKAAYGQEANQENQAQPDADSVLTQPFLGNFTLLDLMGLAFVLVAGYAVIRKYKK